MTPTTAQNASWELVATAEETSEVSVWDLIADGNSETHELDWDAVRRALELFVLPLDGIHFQAPASSAKRTTWPTRIAIAGDMESMLAVIRELNGPHAIYFGLNPVKADLALEPGKDVKAADILRYVNFPIDCDPPKDAGVGISATQEEKDKALELGSKVLAFLTTRGWPQPAITDTGNGCCLVYRVALDNVPLSQALLKKCLHQLGDMFSPNKPRKNNAIAQVDRGMHNADRIIKLPGSWACKGPDTPDRPHRQCQIMFAPAVMRPVSLVQIQELAGSAAESLAELPSRDPWELTATASANTKAAYAQSALERECGKMACTPKGFLNETLNECAFSLGTLVGAGLLSENMVFSCLLGAAKAAGCNDPHKDESTIRRGIEAGKEKPRQIPDKPTPTTATAMPLVSAVDKIPPEESILLWASDVVPRKVTWLWRGRLPMGKLITFAGMGGVGKTFVICDITARISRGLPWPDGDGHAPRGKVLFLSAEDAPDDTLVPRMIECGADLKQIAFLKNSVQDYFTLGDLKTLERARAEAGDDVLLVALDPPTSFLGGVDDHKNSELRALLGPLASWAQQHGIAVIFNTHLNKNASKGVDAVMRVMGGIAWTTAVRIAHVFASDPDDEEKALFCPMKVNLGKKKKGLAYRILPLADEQARVDWLGEVNTTANEAVNATPPKKKKRVVLAAAWLAEVFATVEELSSNEVYKRAKEQTTLSPDALAEGKEEIGIKAYKKRDEEGKQSWHWYWLPAAKRKWEEKAAAEAAKDDFSPKTE